MICAIFRDPGMKFGPYDMNHIPVGPYHCNYFKPRWIFCLSSTEWVLCDGLCLYWIAWTFLNYPDLTKTGLPFSVSIIQNVFDLSIYDIESIIIIIDKEAILFSRHEVNFLLFCISYFILFETISKDFDTFTSWNSVGRWFKHSGTYMYEYRIYESAWISQNQFQKIF